MEQNQQFQCTGDCMKCLPQQRAYCGCQHAYSNMKVLDALMGEVIELQKSVKNLSEKIEAIQNNEALVFDPNNITPSDDGIAIAQEGVSAI